MSLSAERKEQFTEAFEMLGKKADAVDENTMGVIMRSLGQNPSSDEVSELFKKHSGGNKTVGVNAVLAAAGEFETAAAGKDLTAAMKEAFAVFDKDKTGQISTAELRHVVAGLGEKFDEEEIDQMMKEADSDNSGTINYKDFVAVLVRPVKVPPKVDIPEDLLPYMHLDKKKKGKEDDATAD